MVRPNSSSGRKKVPKRRYYFADPDKPVITQVLLYFIGTVEGTFYRVPPGYEMGTGFYQEQFFTWKYREFQVEGNFPYRDSS